MAKKFTVRKIHRYLSIFIAIQLLLPYKAYSKFFTVRATALLPCGTPTTSTRASRSRPAPTAARFCGCSCSHWRRERVQRTLRGRSAPMQYWSSSCRARTWNSPVSLLDAPVLSSRSSSAPTVPTLPPPTPPTCCVPFAIIDLIYYAAQIKSDSNGMRTLLTLDRK